MSVTLTQPSVGSTNWGTDVNTNWSLIQNAFAGTQGIAALAFDDQMADPVSTGILQRNGSNLEFHDGTAARKIALFPYTPAPTSSQILVNDGTIWVPKTVSGDATLSSAGALTIANNAITNAKILNTTIDLTAKVTGALPVANGGTGLSTLTAHALQIGNGASSPTQLAVPAAGTVLQGKASADPAWTTHLVLGSAGSSNGALEFQNGYSGSITLVPPNAALGSYIVNLPTSGANLLAIDNMTYGDMLVAVSAAVVSRLSIGASGKYLRSDGTGPSWSSILAADLPIIPVANGGTNSSTALSGGRPIISNASQIVESSGYVSVTHSATPYVVAVGDCDAVIAADASSGAVEIDLPAAGSGNKGFRITVINAGTSGKPTIKPNGTNKIDGTSVTHTLNAANYGSHLVLRSNGVDGWIVEDAVDWLNSTVNISCTSPTGQNITSISLTPGEWDITGLVSAVWASGTQSDFALGLSTSSATFAGTFGDQYINCYGPNGSYDITASIPTFRTIITASSTIWYLVAANTNGAASNPITACYGRISARRVR